MSSQNDDDTHNIARFLTAQNKIVQGTTTQYQEALSQLQKGRKTSHWMWYIFPQVSGLSTPKTGKLYAIESLAEASAYLTHKVLGARLVAATQAVLDCGEADLVKLFGTKVDADRFCSSVTLFALVCEGTGEDVFQNAVDTFFDGVVDGKTTEILKSLSEAEVESDAGPVE